MKKNASFSASASALSPSNNEAPTIANSVEHYQPFVATSLDDENENDDEEEEEEDDDDDNTLRKSNLGQRGKRMLPGNKSTLVSIKNTPFSHLRQSEDTNIPPPPPPPPPPPIIHLDKPTSKQIEIVSQSSVSHNSLSTTHTINSSTNTMHPPSHPLSNNNNNDPYSYSYSLDDLTTLDASDDDIILSLISNTLFLWGALFVLIVSLWDLTSLKLQSDLPIIVYDDNIHPSHYKVNIGLYNTASLLGPIFYFLNAIFDYLWAIFVKEKTSLYAKYLGRMDPLWDILYGVFFGLGAIMDLINASVTISLRRSDGNKDDYQSFFTLFCICSTFFYLVSGLFFLFAVEFTTFKHPVKMIILLGDCLFLAGSAMDFFLSLISDPDIVIEDVIRIAHGHIVSNSFWAINAALYLCADIVVWCTRKQSTSSSSSTTTSVEELVSIVMKDLTLDRTFSSRSRSLSSTHHRMSSWRTQSGYFGHGDNYDDDDDDENFYSRSKRAATLATVEDGLPNSTITAPARRSRLSTWDIFMSRPIVVPPPSSSSSPSNRKNEHDPLSDTTTTTTTTINNNSTSWDLFLSRPRFRRATLATVEDVQHELELTESLDAHKGTMT